MIKSKKLFVKAMVCWALILGFGGAAGAQKPKYIWKAATLAPKGIGWSKQVNEIMIPAIKKATNNGLGVKVYFGGILGDDEEVIRKMRNGQVDTAGFTGQGAVLLCSEFAVLELPFMFNDYNEVDYIREKMFSTFSAYLEKTGMIFTFWIDQDFDQLYSVNTPLSKVEHFSQAKFLTWYGILEENMLKRLGASPIPMKVPEISSCMRQGVADALLAPAVWMVGTQLYGVIKYVNPLKIRYSPAVLTATDESLDRLPPEYKEGIRKIRDDVTRQFITATRKDNETCLKAMVQYGIVNVRVHEEDVEKIKERVMPVWDDMAGKLYPHELLDELKAHLADYRAK